MFWLFPETGSMSEWTVNRTLIVYTTLNFCINKKNINFHFRHVPSFSFNYPCFLLSERNKCTFQFCMQDGGVVALNTSFQEILDKLLIIMTSPVREALDKVKKIDLLHICFKVYLSPKNIFWYVTGTHFRSPLHQNSKKKVHRVMK